MVGIWSAGVWGVICYCSKTHPLLTEVKISVNARAAEATPGCTVEARVGSWPITEGKCQGKWLCLLWQKCIRLLTPW